MLIGYMRVSTSGDRQVLDLQRDALLAAGIDARHLFEDRVGEIRDRTYENQQHRASGLNLIVTAIILWNTRYLERAVATLRQTENVPEHLLAHLSPSGWEHINLTGDYIWVALQDASENHDGLKPLRIPPEAFRK